MKNRIEHRLILAFVCLLILQILAGVASGDMVMQSSDVIIQWNNVSLNAIKTAQYTSVKASRVLAMVHAAMFDSINNIDQTCSTYYVNTVVPQDISREAAAASAAYRVLVSLFPAQTAAFDTALAESLAGIPDGSRKTNGIALGDYIGNEFVIWRSSDHSDDMIGYIPGSDPGDWQPTPPAYAPAMLPNWAIVTPFAMMSNSQFRPAAPPDLTSAEYAEDYNEVKTIGTKFSVVRTQDQNDIALFWMDMPGTLTTVGRWNVIAQQVANRHSNNLWQNARLFALLNIALADAGITAWDSKYYYNFWRPVTAIRFLGDDGNPDTIPDASWEPLIMTPAFPEYVSAHSTFSAAAAEILSLFFRDDYIDFTISSYMMPMIARSYRSFTQAAEEAGISRIYGGIHFNTANVEGQMAGRALANYVFKNFITPINAYPDIDGIDTDGDGDPDNDNVFIHVSAGDGFVNMADGRLMYMFGFGSATGIPKKDIITETMLAAESPSPTIVVKEGQKLYLSLTNVGMMVRPDLFDAHTIHWHGFANAAPVFDGVPDASISINMGFTFTYFYNVVDPGTYMWHCHFEATEHMQMGMLGNLWVLPKQNNLADGTNLDGFTHRKGYRYIYNDGDGSTYYDVDSPIQIQTFDPDFHDASFLVQPLPFANMKDKYPMINGRGYPDTVDPDILWNTASDEGFMDRPSQPVSSLITANQGDKIALRISNLSTTDFHTLTVLGIPMKVVGQGSRLLRGPTGRDTSYTTTSVTLGGGEAYDVILDTSGVEPGTYALYTTNLNFLSNNEEDFGGIMTEIIINP